jgi:hypothetical protein
MRQYISYSWISRRPIIQLEDGIVLIEFGIPIKLVRLIKMCLNETIVESI